jgi:glycosyltransferase involved in cell wall biosynthesis
MEYRRDPSRLPLASIIVPAYNEADHLRECLASFEAQDYPDYEVILVDNGSTDNTEQVCACFPKVRYIYFNRCKSSYAARNEGARQARGEVLVFFDADQTALPECLSLLLAEYDPRDPNRVYVGLLMDDPRIPPVLAGSYNYPSIEAQKKGQIGTCYAAVPRKLFDDLGGFKADVLSCGDLEFFGRAAKVAQICICSRAGGYHYWARNLHEVLVREERMGFGMCLRAKSEGVGCSRTLSSWRSSNPLQQRSFRCDFRKASGACAGAGNRSIGGLR